MAAAHEAMAQAVRNEGEARAGEVEEIVELDNALTQLTQLRDCLTRFPYGVLTDMSALLINFYSIVGQGDGRTPTNIHLSITH